MQKRATSDNITIDYEPFDSFFREDGGRVHHGYHCPPMHPIRDLHHHDALELGYCLEGSGVFWIDGALIPYTAPCACASSSRIIASSFCSCPKIGPSR